MFIFKRISGATWVIEPVRRDSVYSIFMLFLIYLGELYQNVSAFRENGTESCFDSCSVVCGRLTSLVRDEVTVAEPWKGQPSEMVLAHSELPRLIKKIVSGGGRFFLLYQLQLAPVTSILFILYRRAKGHFLAIWARQAMERSSILKMAPKSEKSSACFFLIYIAVSFTFLAFIYLSSTLSM